MVILHLYDRINGYRYRKVSIGYYNSFTGEKPFVIGVWFVPGTISA